MPGSNPLTLDIRPLRRRTPLSFRPGQFAWLHDPWHDGYQGNLLLDVLERRPALTAPHAHVCGAAELLDETRSALLRLGLPTGRIHVHRPDLLG